MIKTERAIGKMHTINEQLIMRCDSPSQRRRILEEPTNAVYAAKDLMKSTARLGITATERENIEEPVVGVVL